jgi:hypothetical protein
MAPNISPIFAVDLACLIIALSLSNLRLNVRGDHAIARPSILSACSTVKTTRATNQMFIWQ